jgi:2,3-diketo-5-methylthiopentyl-1-phosphate enolase
LTERFGKQLAFLAHYAGVGVFDHENQGIASPVILGKLARLAGADSVMVMYPGDKQGPGYFEYLRTIQAHRFKFGGFKPVMSSIGGGVTPLSVGRIYEDLGMDVIMGVGGAIQGHPMGTEAGARAVMHALKSAVAGQSLAEAAANCPELQKAVDVWR